MSSYLKRWRNKNKDINKSLMQELDIDDTVSFVTKNNDKHIVEIENNELNFADDDYDGNISYDYASDLSSINQDPTREVSLLGNALPRNEACQITSSLLIDKSDVLSNDLAAWATRNRCTRKAVNELLNILNKNGVSSLPYDCKTLLKTPKYIKVKELCGGEYIYFGIKKGIKQVLKDSQRIVERIDMLINIDGLPLCKSSSTQFWPILAKFSVLQPFIVCLFCGKKKPDNLFDYLNEFLVEFRLLQISGIELNGRIIPVSIKAFVCDVPARSFLKNIKGHGGYHSCERCLIEGEYDGRVVFTEVNCQLRSDEQFKEYIYLNHSLGTNNVCCAPHQLGSTPLVDYGILCVKEFIIDYMHCVCLGVMKQLLKYWFEGPRFCRLSCQQKKQMSDKLAFYHGKMPSEFAR